MRRSTVAVWGTALALYGAFWLWYVGLPRPLSASEIDAHMARIGASEMGNDPARMAALRAFLEADDGGEFFMVNLVKLRPGPVTPPDGGAPRSAAEVLDGYMEHFMPAFLRRAGHPAFFGRAAGGYLEQWNVEADPGWTLGAAMRYRSRRDMLEIVEDPRFENAHLFKEAAIERTLAFPAAPGLVVAGPRIWVGLVLALVAALATLAVRPRPAAR